MQSDLLLWFEIVGVVLAALGLAVVSLVEAAMVSVSRVRLHQLIEQDHPTAPLVLELTANPQQLLGGLVILINIFVLLAANLTTRAALHVRLTEGQLVWVNLGVLIILLVFAEITPKTLSVHFAEGIALRTARFAVLLNRLLAPLANLLTAISFVILRLLTAIRLLPGRVQAVPTAFSEEDIKQLITAGEQSGEVEAAEREMIHGVIEFAETSADEIMVPRTDLVALADDTTLEEAISEFLTSGHSRIPVYRENADNILGILYIKDLLIQLHAAGDTGSAPPITQLLRPAYFVPESKKSDELLREMQRKHVHLAVVVDEYGGTAGIITIEDLLEEIVGEIVDEYDHERQDVVVLPDGIALVSGRASLEKVEESFDLTVPETEAETISGLVTDLLGRIPELGDQVVVGGVRFTVLEVAHNRIERLRAEVLPAPPPTE